MRVLLDECVPSRLRRELPEHDVRTVPEMGWASKENGALLELASSTFDVFINHRPKTKLSTGLGQLRYRGRSPRSPKDEARVLASAYA